MKNVSNIKLNLLVDKLYLESVVNKIYEESSEFDWVKDADTIDLSFSNKEFWIDISKLDVVEKNRVLNYLITKYDALVDAYSLREFRRNTQIVNGLILHCELEGYEDTVPVKNEVCIMETTFEDDDNSPNAYYINGLDLIPQINHYFNIDGYNLNESEEKEPNTLKDIINDLNISRSFLFTFGTGISSLMGPVTKLLEGSGIQLNKTEITLLIVTALAILLNESHTDGAIKKLKEKGIYQYLQGVKDFITNTHKLINTVLKNVADVTYGLADILGFAFILQPSMKILTELINDYGVNLSSVGQLLVGVTAGAATYGVKSVIKKLKNKIGKGDIKESKDEWGWVRDTGNLVPITDLKPNEGFIIADYPESFIDFVDDALSPEYEFNDILGEVFYMDSEEIFTDDYMVNHTDESGGDTYYFWLIHDFLGLAEWIPVEGVYVQRVG